LKPLGVSITTAADALGVTRKHVSEIVNGHAPVSADMAIHLTDAGGTGSQTGQRETRCGDAHVVRVQLG
jgi:addiction module HigA family antidote